MHFGGHTPARMDVLVIDIGGTNVKLKASTTTEAERFKSGRELTPDVLVAKVKHLTHGWMYEAISIGYPGAVDAKGPAAEPGNLGEGWVGFDFEEAFGRSVRIVNDAVMQAIGAYDGGRMLFLGLGTGVGSTLVTEHVVIPLELGRLPYPDGSTIAESIGRAAREANGRETWIRDVLQVIDILRDAFTVDYVVLGGGNAKHVEPLPGDVRRGSNEDAFTGGFRLWEEIVEPHDRHPAPVWRVVR